MKILLINPSLLESNISHYSRAIEKNRGIYPPLGLAYIGSVLEKDGHAVKIIDLDAFDLINKIDKISKHYDPDIIGMYVMTWTFRQANYILKKIKKILPNVKAIIGGPNVSSFPLESLKYSDFDFAVCGEGEETIAELINALEKKKILKNIKGLIYKNRIKKIIINPQRKLIQNLDKLPFPIWHLLPIKKYFDVFARKKKIATMITSRGCPFDCTFCDRLNRMGKTYRTRSAKNIVDEIELLYNKYKIKEFMFFDDNFIIKKEKNKKICNEILNRRLDILWECRARVDLVDKELLTSMKKSGCYRIRYGMESGDNKILKILRKDITVQQIIDAAKITKKKKIENFAYFMMGSPRETKETLRKTLDLAIKIKPDFVAFSKTILIIGSELFEWGVKNNQISKDYWKNFLLGKETNPAPAISTKELPEEYIDKFISYSEKKFYFRPEYIAKRLINIKNFTQAYKQGRLALSMLK